MHSFPFVDFVPYLCYYKTADNQLGKAVVTGGDFCWVKKKKSLICFKESEEKDQGNCRQVSLLSVPVKFMDQNPLWIYFKIYDEQNVTGNRQHGFNKGKSYMANLIVSCDEMTGFVDKGKTLDVIYLDFSKSFDMAFHKMRWDGFGKVLKIWLNCQAQWVMISNRKSRFQPVISSPQESITGSTLKYLYIT